MPTNRNKGILWDTLNSNTTSHSAYDATSTELYGVKIDGTLYPNLMKIPKKEAKSSSSIDFLAQGSDSAVEVLSAYFFWIHVKFGCKNPLILTPYNFRYNSHLYVSCFQHEWK